MERERKMKIIEKLEQSEGDRDKYGLDKKEVSAPYQNINIINDIYGKMRKNNEEKRKLANSMKKHRNLFTIGRPVRAEGSLSYPRSSSRRKAQSADPGQRYKKRERKNIKLKEKRPNSVSTKQKEEQQGLKIRGMGQKKPLLNFKVTNRKKNYIVKGKRY